MRDLSLHLLDILMNSISAEATEIELAIVLYTSQMAYRIDVVDNGIGLSSCDNLDATDPFYTTKPACSTGLGLALFREACEQTGGSLSMDSLYPSGVHVSAYMVLTSINCLPLGDVAQTMAALIYANPSISFTVKFCRDHVQNTQFHSCDLRAKFDHGASDAKLDAYFYIYDTIKDQMQTILGGNEYEITCRT